MKVKAYITYDRYEGDEWFTIYQITRRLSEVKRNWKKNLIDFISYGPDDCHSYQIQVVELDKEIYDELVALYNDQNADDSAINEIMSEIYDWCDWNSNCLLATDGCSDNMDLVKFYMEEQGEDPEDDDLFYDYQEQIFDDNDLYSEILSRYIDATYSV